MLPTTPGKRGNPALKLVNEEIDNALVLYPEEVQREVFASSEYRQQLIEYVVSRVICDHMLANDGQDPLSLPKFPYHSLELRLKVETLIHRGIRFLFPVKSALMIYYSSAEKPHRDMIDFATQYI